MTYGQMNDRFEFDISISGAKKRTRKPPRGMSGAVETSTRECARSGCRRKGKFRAPVSPEQLDEYLWFCEKHVREYNAKWNFFKGQDGTVDPAQDNRNGFSSEEQRRIRNQKAWSRLGISDPHEILGELGTNRTDPKNSSLARLPPEERQALSILDAKPTWPKHRIREKYKSLVKDCHPDLNGGDRSAEEQLNKVVWAWERIKVSKHFQP
ncbi:MAG: molecular chaperone DnaJ [Rhodobacteraceae bacterium]|nr:molecular chaperone DnaJ [Paracoccaceae bacterium]